MPLLLSCSDDPMTGHQPEGETITIVKNDLLFGAQGSTATVEVRSAGSLTATTDADWAVATVSGSVVSVTVDTNTHYEGRTAILTISNGQDSRRLPIQQRGVIVGTMPVKDLNAAMSGQQYAYTVAHDLPMTFTASVDWIHADIDGERLTVTVDANSEGHLRRGRLVSECNGLRDTLNIVQYDMMTDVAGSYYMMGYSGGIGGPAVATSFDIVLSDGALYMNWPTQAQWKNTFIQLPFDAASCTITIPSMLQLYENGSSYDYGFFYDTNGVVASSNRMGADARLLYAPAGQTSYAPLTASNWAGHELGGFVIRSSRGGGLVVTNLLQIAQPMLVRQ